MSDTTADLRPDDPRTEIAAILSARVPRCRLGDLPAGSWEREHHLDAPVVTAMEPILAAFGRGFSAGFAHWGWPIDAMRQLVVDGWLYMGLEPLRDLDEVVRRIGRADHCGDLQEFRVTAHHWIDHVLPGVETARRSLDTSTLDTLDTGDLVQTLVRAYEHAVGFAERRFHDIPATNLLTAAFLLDAADAGLARGQAMAALAGSSAASTSLARLAASPDGAELDGADGDEAMSTDLLAPVLAELVADRRLHRPLVPVPIAAVAVPGHLRDSLADARLAQDVRERSRGELARAIGRIRRLVRTLGGRLVDAGELETLDDVVFLGPDELAAVVRGTDGGRAERAARVRSRRHEYDEALAIVPAPALGDPDPGPPSGLDTLPPGAARVFVLAGTWMQAMNGTPPVAVDGALSGIGAASGTATGRVRVVHHAEDVLAVEPGEVMVCSTTTPAWCLAIAVAAAVVAETGGELSHPAITAREFGIPAVVGAAGAMAALRDGDLVEVDGDRGTVRRVELPSG